VDKHKVIADIEELVPPLASMIRSAPDPRVNAVGSWNLQELAAHLVASAEDSVRYIGGEGSPVQTIDAISGHSEERLAAYVNESLPELSDRLEINHKQLVEELRTADWSQRVPWYAGIEVTIADLASFELGELLVHGHDIARATSSPWKVNGEAASAVFEGVVSVMPEYVHPEKARGFSATFDLSMRRGPRRHLIFENGSLTVAEPSSDRRVDCRISADPATYLLLGYGRIGPIVPSLTGKIVAYGRKPWLAMKLPTLFRSP
jgi:uncharacterized protein (TIGR03083 family)